ncbi:MAG: hypothetical protein K2O78_05125, partial [Muribaculaceae bacterium]|nr:hypothetical protein [Muribaculaceae bacterium]
GNASGEDNFGVDADGQDPDFGGNASGEDNFGVDADGQDPDFGGNASDEDNFGVDAVPVLNPWCVNLVLAGKEIKEVGTYTVIIPEGFFMAGDYKVDGSVFMYYVVDISSIVDTFKAENKVTVYNLNGVRILDNADVEALRGLEKGMYVINGKKVVLK